MTKDVPAAIAGSAVTLVVSSHGHFQKTFESDEAQPMKTKLAFVLITASSLSLQAALTIVPSSGSLDGDPPGGPGTLQPVMRTLLGNNSYDVNLPANRVDDSFDQVWTGQSGGGVVSTLILEIAGHRAGNSFGIYNLANVNDRVQAFPGTVGGVSAPATINVPASWNGLFGFYLAYETSTFYSRQSDNGGVDNMVTLRTSQQVTLNTSAFQQSGWANGSSVSWSPGEYLLAWEDLRIGHGAEPDYQDMLVKVNAIPVPEPTTILAGALLLLPFAASTIRILRKRS